VNVQIAGALNSGFLLLPEDKVEQKTNQPNLLVSLTDNKLLSGTGVGKIDAAHPDHDAVTGAWLDESKSHTPNVHNKGGMWEAQKKRASNPSPVKQKLLALPCTTYRSRVWHK
jgi:hypothetical protein|tara:strand:- start:148 stop:486 length:339 start_codon:yes stop_codon:yes gene_type:complete